MPKARTRETAKPQVAEDQLEAFAAGGETGTLEIPKAPKAEPVTARTSISLPADMLEAVEDLALANKRSGKELKTVSAIIRAALDEFLVHK